MLNIYKLKFFIASHHDISKKVIKKSKKKKKTKKEKEKGEVGLFGHQYGRLICGHYGQIIGGHRYIWPIDRLLHCTEGLYICFV